ncbi:MAG: DegQ family serine endoprotease, partial [Candidatus Binatia bacterium]
FPEVAEAASPAVVNVATTQTVKAPGVEEWLFGPFGGQGPFGDFFRGFGPPNPRQFRRRSLGSGFVIDSDGTIVTNHHVIAGADEIVVRLSSGAEEYEAKVLGSDPKTDLALLQIEPERELPRLRLGDSERMRVGSWVVAIGNPFGLQNTVTAGIISATDRAIGQGPYDDFIQTDASINPGNSGGPLLNLRGEVVGINTAIFSRAGGNLGIGFAIPSSLARPIVEQLRTKGKVVRGWLGVATQEVDEDLAESFGLEKARGALVSDVRRGSPADDGGIARGDVIVAYDGKPVASSAELPAAVAATPPGERVEVEVVRNGEKKTLEIEVGEMPVDVAARPAEGGAEGDLGLAVGPVTPDLAGRLDLPDAGGVVVRAVRPGSPADEAGIRPGDVILEVDREEVESVEDFAETVRGSDRKSVLFLVQRGEATVFLALRRER